MTSKKSVLTILTVRLALCMAVTASFGATANAQDFDDLESELDAASTGSASSTSAAKAAPKDSSKDESKDDVLDDLEEPLVTNLEAEEQSPPPKKTEAKKSAPVVAKKAKAAPAPEPAPAPAEPYLTESLAPSSDEPNAAFEARLAGIYSQHSDPVSDEKWSGLIGSRAAETYSVQAGDTLWDLSHTLFADGFYWSKLWAENPEIHNPHQISKGQALRFISGTEASAPEIRVVKDEPDKLTLLAQANFDREDVIPAVQDVKAEELIDIDSGSQAAAAKSKPVTGLNQAPYYQEDIDGKITQADLDAGVVIEQSEVVPRPVLPPPSENRRKVLLDIPKSFGEYRPQVYDKTVTILRRNKAAEKIPGAVVPPFIAFESLPDTLGMVEEVDQGELIASIGQYVYIKANSALVIGSKVYSGSSRFDVKSAASGRLGSAVEIGGVLRVVELTDEKTNLYRALVVYVVNPVRVGSLVLAGEPPRIPVTTKGRRLPGELIVVGGSYSDTRRFFGDGNVVFLETRGSGVRVGDVLSVQARRGERKSTIAPDQTNPIGILKVFSVSGKVASAVVVLATEEIRVGDRTGANFPARLPELRIEAPQITQSSAE